MRNSPPRTMPRSARRTPAAPRGAAWRVHPSLLAVAVAAGLACPLPVPPAAAGEPSGLMHALAAPLKALHRRPPATCQDASIERVAAELDWLRHHVESHGSVVAKQPDVWGQNRLTRHRAEYEEQLRAQLGAFLELNHASLRQSDQSFLGLALALDEAAAPSPRAAARPAAATANVTTMISNPATGSGNEAVIARSAPFAATGQPFATFGLDAANAVGLEPTIHLDHLSRYLNHLHELRRINEGDDVADSPGYALNLVRIPVSITPGQHTQAGHGAEITITAEPQLGDDLLPTTFQNLVVNDLVDLLAPGLTFAVNTSLVRAGLEGGTAASLPAHAVLGTRSRSVSVPSPKTRRARMPLPPEQLVEAIGERQIAILLAGVHEALATDPASAPCIDYSAVRGFLLEELRAATDFLAQPRQAHAWAELPAWNLAEAVRSRRAGDLELRRRAFFDSLGADLPPSEPLAGPVGLPQPAWGLPGAVPPTDGGLPAPCGSACANTLAARCLCRTTTAVLAWAVLVESALLDERLVDDMRETAAAKGLCDGSAVAGPFYGPRPAPEARAAFNAYVRGRWPIRVFALDPVTQEQNVEDLSSRRREMQLAMALAASSGRANAQALARYAHRLETDMATVSLNKTAVGFTHGADTFGWRFYPRMQPPPARGNLGALADTLCGTNPTVRDLASRRLEPGVRECTAIIVMPSFVPFVTFAVQSGWFSLVHPQAAEPTMRRALTLSRSVKAVQQSAAACAQGEHCYRDGDVAHLMRALEQLDRRLPFQTMVAQIPHENTAGGFELFSTGITDLAPDLIGWYGAAGIDPSGTTTLFLLGRGFGVHDTSVIAGGRPVKVTLLGRQLARVEIPPGVRTIRPAVDPRCAGEAGLARHPRSPLVRLATNLAPAAPVDTPSESPASLPPASLPPASLPPASEPLPAPTGRPSLRLPVPEMPLPGIPLPGMTTADENSLDPRALGGSCGFDCQAREVVDVRLATPHGVSGQLFIPVISTASPGIAGFRLTIDQGSVVRLSATQTKAGTWRVNEFFESSPDRIRIAAPEVFAPPARATLTFLLRDTLSGMTAGTFSIPAPPFDARTRHYVLAGSDLRNFVGDTSRPATDKTLRGAVKPFLDSLGSGTLPDGRPVIDRGLTLTAELVADQLTIPVDGAIAVEVRHHDQAAPDPEDAPPTPPR